MPISCKYTAEDESKLIRNKNFFKINVFDEHFFRYNISFISEILTLQYNFPRNITLCVGFPIQNISIVLIYYIGSPAIFIINACREKFIKNNQVYRLLTIFNIC